MLLLTFKQSNLTLIPTRRRTLAFLIRLALMVAAAVAKRQVARASYGMVQLVHFFVSPQTQVSPFSHTSCTV
jgi:hypothetical protein